MTAEIMWQVVALIPSQYRGVYNHLGATTQDYLDSSQGALSTAAERPTGEGAGE